MIKELILEADRITNEECGYTSCDDCKYNIIINENGENICNAVLRLANNIKYDKII